VRHRGGAVEPATVDALLEVADGRPGILVAGAGAGAGDAPGDGEPVLALGRTLGWPVLADPRAWPRRPDRVLVAAADGIVRSRSAATVLVPEVVVHLGAPHASKGLAAWNAATAAAGAEHVLVVPDGRYRDPERLASLVLHAAPADLARSVVARVAAPTVVPDWLGRWRAAEDAAQDAIDAVLHAHGDEVSEIGLARALFARLTPESTLVVSSSMPVRDVEWYAKPRVGAPRVLANRGANGIDGVTSTVLGAAAAVDPPGRRDVVGLLGDLAFLHDVSGLVWGRAEACPSATLVVVDNAGGGIFNFLGYAGELDAARFERGFATPQRADIASVAAAFGWASTPLTSLADLDAALATGRAGEGITVVVARTDRQQNVALHAELNRVVAAAVDRALEGDRAESAGATP
jgi:2-succinyl-5-enolpyruvyl-6-hydroxy-3-cyclohexene-1-carboxylate synthase